MKKLSKKQVASIKKDIAAGLKQPEIGAKHGVGRGIISDIATGRRHADVPWPAGSAEGRRPSPMYDPTNQRILELESEVVHLKDERNRERQKVKANAKVAGLFRALVKEMEQRVTPIKALPSDRPPTKKDAIHEHLVLHLSDMHADQVIRPAECGDLEEYNFPVACARAEKLVDTTLGWTQHSLAPNFRFPHLWVLMNGDLTSGQIHGHEQRSYYRNQLKNCFAIGTLLALMFRDFAPYFEHVHIVSVSGNHGRWSHKKDHLGPLENWDYLVAETARMLTREIKNIGYFIPEAYSVNLNINGNGLSLFHGDDVKSNLGLPVYGLLRRQKNLLALGAMRYTTPIRYFACGHFHSAITLADLDGEMLVNGAWPGVDAYSYNSFAGYREPTQLLHGMHERQGVSWRLPVKLKFQGDTKGPKRYKIDGGRDVGPLLL